MPKMNSILENSVICKDFLKAKEQPSLDAFLDYRLRLVELKKNCYSIRERKAYRNEIKAVDEILKRIDL